MSGYLEVKYPFKSNLGLNPFKSWKRQWCILRPSPTCGGGSLAVYCSEAGAAAGAVELPSGCVVKRAKSRTRPYAFAVFSLEEPSKPRVLLAGQTLQDTQNWMDKIRELLNGDKQLGTEKLLKDSYSMSVIATDLSRKCQLSAESMLTLSSTGLLVSRPQKLGMFVEWRYMREVLLSRENGDRHRTCTITIDRGFSEGQGEMKFSSALSGELATALKQALRLTAAASTVSSSSANTKASKSSSAGKKLSRSEGDLRSSKTEDSGEVRRSSWYSGPSEISLDDTDLVMSKEAQRIPSGPLSRCSGAGDLALRARAFLQLTTLSFDDCASERVSMVSVSSASSGVYEEIADAPPRDQTCERTCERAYEPTYETVAECIYATVRRSARRPAPPLPPRHPFGTMKLGESWSAMGGGGASGARGAGGDTGVTRHSSLGSLPRHCGKTLPKARQPFSVFRKRLKSDSRIATSPKSETARDTKDVETKKKKFDFTPTRDIFKSFKVSRKMKNLKITQGNLGKGETKSCEFLDETKHVTANRCSKSVECLEGSDEMLDEFDADLSLDIADDTDVAALELPQEIVELIIRGRETLGRMRMKQPETEGDYVPMSPIVPPPPTEHHYIVMSPRTHLA